MIYGYFDDSNTHGGSKLLSLCGFLGDPRVWDDLSQEWRQVLNKTDWPRRPAEFHMVDCVHGTGEFQGWSLAQRLAIFGDLAGVVAASNVMALGSVFVADALANRSDVEMAILAKGGLLRPMDFIFSTSRPDGDHTDSEVCGNPQSADCRAAITLFRRRTNERL